MAGISSIGNYNSDYYQKLEQALAEKEAQKAKTNSTAADSTAKITDTASTADSTDTSQTTSLQDKVRSAIISAVHEAENSGTSGDLLSVILEAVEQTLKDAGIDPSTALKNDKVDSSTKKLLTVLDKQVKVEAETVSILSALGTQSGTASSPIDLLSQLSAPTTGNLANQNLLGYLFDAQQ
jgi:hypothetical protein